MYPELVTRGDLEVFLPPIGGQTVYVFGDPHDLANPAVDADRARARRVQRLRRVRLRHLHLPAVPDARDRGVHPRRAARRRRPRRLLPQGRPRARRGDQVPRLQRAQAAGGRRLAPTNYFLRTECVAGVQDMRFQELMPDVLHWLGIRRIHRLVSMSNMKYDAIVGAGIEVGERVKIPDDADPGRRARRDGREEGRRLLHRRRGARRGSSSRDQGPRPVTAARSRDAPAAALLVAGDDPRALRATSPTAVTAGAVAPLPHRPRAPATPPRRASAA